MAACLALAPHAGGKPRTDEEERQHSEAAASPSPSLLRTISQKLRTLRARQEAEGDNPKNLCRKSEHEKKSCYLWEIHGSRSECEGKRIWRTRKMDRKDAWRMTKYFRVYRGKGKVKGEIEESEETKCGLQIGGGYGDDTNPRVETLGCFGFYGEREKTGLKSRTKVDDSEAHGHAVGQSLNPGNGLGFVESTEESQEWEDRQAAATCGGCFRVESQCQEVRAGDGEGLGLRPEIRERSRVEICGEDQQSGLPDDILEMCLARAPLPTLMRARTVCKKWRSLTLSPHFLQLRARTPNRKPWLFLFGLSRDGVCMGQIQGLDPTSDQWFRIKAEKLTGRFLYSVTAIGSSIYIVGGCSSASSPQRPAKGPLRIHKSLLIFNVLTGQWRKGCPMNIARSVPIVGVFEIQDKHFTYESKELGSDRAGTNSRRRSRSQRNSEVEVYGGYHSFRSGNMFGHRRIADFHGLPSFGESQQIWQTLGKIDRIEWQENPYPTGSTLPRPEKGRYEQRNGGRGAGRQNFRHQSMSEVKRYGLIVIGGQGFFNEPLESAEIYDSLSDRWMKIASWPVEYGNVCSGVVCKGMFFAYSETDKLAAYDFDQGVWIGILVSATPPRLHEYLPKLTACKDRLFLIGVSWPEGENNAREQASRKVWELSEASGSRTWAEISQHPDAPLDWNAVFVPHEERIFGVEMFKIFGQVLDFVTVCDVSSSQIKWDRVSRRRMAHDMDASSCLTKTAVVVQL